MSMNLVLCLSHELHNLKLRTRVAMAPMTRTLTNGTSGCTDYYRRRAEAGVGLIITEGTVVNHAAANGYPNVPAFYGDEALAGWKQVVDAVHEVGGAIFPQWQWARCAKKVSSRIRLFPVTALQACLPRASPTARR